MSSIGIDTMGNIGLVYNVTSQSTFPSVRFVSRSVCDDISIDPVTGHIWATAMHNPSVLWSTRVSQLDLDQSCEGVLISPVESELVLCDMQQLEVLLNIDYLGNFDDTLFVRLIDNSGLIDSVILQPSFLIASDSLSISLGATTVVDTSIDISIELFNDSILIMEPIDIIVLDSIADSILLLHPMNQLVSADLQPEFLWNSNLGVDSFRFLLSEDSSFSAIIVDSLLNDTTVSSLSLLDPQQNYFWKVDVVDLCGKSISSEIFEFETIFDTIQCFSFQNDDDVIIPNSQDRVGSIITFPHDAIIVDVNIISMSIDHTFVSDLFIELISPENIRVPLISFVCNTENDIDIGLDAQSLRPNFTIPCPPTDELSYQPVGDLDLYNDMISAGDWELSVFDAFDLDGGTIDSWELEICVNTIESLCSDTLYLFQDPLLYDFNIARKNVISNAKLTEPLSYQIIAGEEINFVENFEIELGSHLEATIEENVNCVEPNFGNN
jgi:subtilisin-like proprotein convertase family protein